MMEINKIYHGKMEEVLPTFPENVIHSIIGDPPYGLKFMGKKWDYDVPSVDQWKAAYRTLKPGGYMLIACGTRTQHRMVVNIEDAGFEIRDVITWHYGSGFPKSLDISKAIDKASGAEREVISEGKPVKRIIPGADQNKTGSWIKDNGRYFTPKETIAATEGAQEWEGWGTALKPATEFWTLCRKPLSENTVAENVLKHGTGGINIDACRIEFTNEKDKKSAVWGRGTDILGGNYVGATHTSGKENIEPNNKGRFPANLILDDFMAAELDKQSEILTTGSSKSSYIRKESLNNCMSGKNYERPMMDFEGDSGGASRFFYVAKASQEERSKGLDKNFHPTVKPIELMRHLVKMITPKGGICVDPFCGSGTTLIACKLELMNYIGIEMEKDYVEISEARIAAWNPEKYKPQTLF